jgi:hypothetical protein
MNFRMPWVLYISERGVLCGVNWLGTDMDLAQVVVKDRNASNWLMIWPVAGFGILVFKP